MHKLTMHHACLGTRTMQTNNNEANTVENNQIQNHANNQNTNKSAKKNRIDNDFTENCQVLFLWTNQNHATFPLIFYQNENQKENCVTKAYTIRNYTFNIGYLRHSTSVLELMLKVPMLNVLLLTSVFKNQC